MMRSISFRANWPIFFCAVLAAAQRDYLTILLLSDLLNMLTVAFRDEVSLDLETCFTVYPTYDRIDEYVKFFWKAKACDPKEKSPVFELCTHCKGVKNQTTREWSRIERVIPQLPRNARFSHGLCEPCLNTELNALGRKGVDGGRPASAAQA